MGRQFGVVPVVMQQLYQTVVKKELIHKVKISFYLSVYVSTLTCGRELLVVTERTRTGISSSFIYPQKYGEDIAVELGVELLLLGFEWSQLR